MKLLEVNFEKNKFQIKNIYKTEKNSNKLSICKPYRPTSCADQDYKVKKKHFNELLFKNGLFHILIKSGCVFE